MNTDYQKTVRLLLEVAPSLFRRNGFALKGGTAINLFLHDMPRLSVDLDLVYLDHLPARDEALSSIAAQLGMAAAELHSLGYACESGASGAVEETKLFISQERRRVKVEVNHVFRGSILPVKRRALAPAAQDTFLTDIELPVLHSDELYGSKLVAAMDRQHPRDLFDVLLLYENGGLTEGIVECFVCYLAGHNRPVHEVLFANEVDIAPAFANEFEGMSRRPVSLKELLDVRAQLFSELPTSLTDLHKTFLSGLIELEPDW